MLTRLLRLLATSRTTDVTSLARELGVSTSLVEMMLEDLTRRHILRPGCPASCRGCPWRGPQEGCPVGLWILTPQGQRLARSIEEKHP